MPSKKQHDLLSKSDIAKALGMTSQTFSNRQSRDKDFPAPTYSNRSGSVALYAPEDAKKVYEYCTRAERERLQKAEQLFANLTGGGEPTFENVELPLEKEEAPAAKAEAKAEEVKAEAPAPAEKPAEKAPEAPAPKADPAADKAAADKAAADKAAKEKATAEKIKAADAKIAANKAAAQATAAKAPTTAPKTAPTATSKGTGAAFGITAK